MKKGVLIATAAALVAAGFLLGRSLGTEKSQPPFGTQLHTLGQDQPEVTVPAFSPGGNLPPIETTIVETTVEGESSDGESEPAEEPVSSGPKAVVTQKEEKSEPPPTSPSPPPDVTIGDSE